MTDFTLNECRNYDVIIQALPLIPLSLSTELIKYIFHIAKVVPGEQRKKSCEQAARSTDKIKASESGLCRITNAPTLYTWLTL